MENTQVKNSTEKANSRKRSAKVKKFVNNRPLFFSIVFVLFAFAGFMLFTLDESNFLRATMPGLDPFADFFKGLGIHFDVSMLTWLIFFFFVLLFFAVFTTLYFKKSFLGSIERKVVAKTGEPMTHKQTVLFNVVYFILALIVLAGLAAVIVVVFPIDMIPPAMIEPANIGKQLINFGQTMGIVVLLLSVIPLSISLLYCFFIIIIYIVGFFASGVSKSVMKSEDYQETMAASQAAAQDIAATMASAKGLAGDSLAAAKAAQSGSKKNSMAGVDIFPALGNIDRKYEALEAEKASEPVEGEVVEEPKEMTYEEFQQFAYEFQSYLCHQELYFDLNIIRSFIAGLASSRMILLQGLSGTGKTTLPRVFLEYIGSKAWFFPVQATWRDRSDVTGYFSEFANEFKETEFLKHLYEANYTPEKVNLLVLDEMNISRVEYYFADFLSIFEYPSQDWLVPLIQVHEDAVLPNKLEGGMVRIPTNTWFIGTVNIDDSTFTITDKVYDRVIAIDFEELNIPFTSEYNYEKHPLKCGELEKMFAEAKAREENQLSEAERAKFLQLCAFTADTFDVKFGNRIMKQIENFVPVYVALGGTKEQALDLMFANKILRKLNGKFESYIRDGLVKLTRYLNSEYGKKVFVKTEKLIDIINKKLA